MNDTRLFAAPSVVHALIKELENTTACINSGRCDVEFETQRRDALDEVIARLTRTPAIRAAIAKGAKREFTQPVDPESNPSGKPDEHVLRSRHIHPCRR